MERLDTAEQVTMDSVALDNAVNAHLDSDMRLISEIYLDGETLDWVIIAPEALFVLHPRTWAGQIRPAALGAWRERVDSGRVVSHPSIRSVARRQTKALQTFIKSAFPGVELSVHHILLLTNPNAQTLVHGSTDPHLVKLADLRVELSSLTATATGSRLDADMRNALMDALEGRDEDIYQEAREPFTFRSGRWMGFGRRARSVPQAIRHMDRVPEDGIYHLRNGSLARWFEAQGATHLSDLAKQVLRGRQNDSIMLESFLQGSGLVPRPKLSLDPPQPDFGYVCAGERTTMLWRIGKGRGRGYLHGQILSRTPWVEIHPETIDGSADVTITADSAGLSIAEQPVRGEIHLETNASSEPVSVPIRINVRPYPSAFERRVLRPLVGGLLGLLIGLVVGAILDGTALGMGLLAEYAPLLAGLPLWILLMGLAWGVSGAVRGWHQRPAWPTWFASVRWLGRALVWMIGLAVLAQIAYVLAMWLFPALGPYDTPELANQVSLLAASMAFVPALLGEVRAAQYRGVQGAPNKAQAHQRRRAMQAAAGVVALVVVVAVVRFLAPDLTVTGMANDVSERLSGWVAAQNQSLRGLRDDYYLRYYDRRAPQRTIDEAGD